MKKDINIYGINGFNSFRWERVFMLFLLAWLCVNIFQSIFTEALSDETYYYMYGEKLSWGYFDHPPLVGIMVYFSNLLFAGNLSIRFATIILQIFTIIIIWKIIADYSPDLQKVVLFFILMASFVMFQTYGFVTTPDSPFLFFTALFLYSYKRFLKDESLLHTAFLTISMTGMVYSKYHAVLIVGFIVFSNLHLLTRRKFWIAGLLTFLLLTPHIYWQVMNDFPSFQFHLSDRNREFRWSDFLKYFPNQLAVFNPFTFGAVVYILIKHKPKDIFERGMYFLIIGFIVFFWLTSFRGEVEPHWTVAVSIPMIILLYHHSLKNERLMRYVKKVIAPSLLLLLFARIVLTMDLLPTSLDFNGKKEASKRIESIASDMPVVFTGSFQNPSNYHFFTGKESFVLSAITGRRTQFDLLEKELSYQGMPAFVCQENSNKSKKYIVDGHVIYGYFIDNLQTVNRERIEFTLNKTELYPGDTLHIPFALHNPTDYDVNFLHVELPVTCRAAYVIGRIIGRNVKAVFADCELSEPILKLPAHTTIRGNIKTIVPHLEPIECQFTLTLVNPICAARNSEYVPVKILRK
ncbi:MAG: glycosyltransferase family 39 protein [Bacteroidales bacterium]|jgi:hypothetical protein|nr:glycosyltransferase family 39 protein [Bacteroidales bacterium]